MNLRWTLWGRLDDLDSKEYVCGFCGCKVGTNHGYYYNDIVYIRIYICTHCGRPTFFDEYRDQYPGPLLGKEIKNLPADIEKVYGEIREDIKDKSYTSAILLSRKLIMHIAVDKVGAKEGKKFVEYIEFLKRANYIPPNGNKLYRYLLDRGNEKNHEIQLGSSEEAGKMLSFIEMLLYFAYEMDEDNDDSK